MIKFNFSWSDGATSAKEFKTMDELEAHLKEVEKEREVTCLAYTSDQGHDWKKLPRGGQEGNKNATKKNPKTATIATRVEPKLKNLCVKAAAPGKLGAWVELAMREKLERDKYKPFPIHLLSLNDMK